MNFALSGHDNENGSYAKKRQFSENLQDLTVKVVGDNENFAHLRFLSSQNNCHDTGAIGNALVKNPKSVFTEMAIKTRLLKNEHHSVLHGIQSSRNQDFMNTLGEQAASITLDEKIRSRN